MSRDEPRDVWYVTRAHVQLWPVATRRGEGEGKLRLPLQFPVNMVSLYLTPFGPL
jgi:hypothetical protein